MADGLFYQDLRTPFIMQDLGSVTLATTDKALYTAGAFPVLGANYFGYAGKKLKIRLFGRITTVLTPGNGTVDVYYGTGADANGTIIASSAAQTLIASQTNLSWEIEVYVHCRLNGPTGTLFCTGRASFNPAVIAANTFLIPASAPAVSSALDLTSTGIISVQFKRSGSTAETMQVHDMEVLPLN